MVSLNRMERGRESKYALDEISERYGFPACAIVTMKDVTDYLYIQGKNGVITDEIKGRLDAYYAQYGV